MIAVPAEPLNNLIGAMTETESLTDRQTCLTDRHQHQDQQTAEQCTPASYFADILIVGGDMGPFKFIFSLRSLFLRKTVRYPLPRDGSDG
jgi:hypothetical protein